MMRGIVYASVAQTDFDDEALDELGRLAAARNDELGVSGYLYFETGRFFQYIEGEHDAVTELMARIELDPRHEVMHVVYDDRLQQRRFPGWGMRVLTRGELAGIESLAHDHVVFMRQVSPDHGAASNLVWELLERMRDLRRA
jgi:hypothetical protein